MTIKFTKEIEITGEIWYKIWANDNCLKCSRDASEVKDLYLTILNNADKGFPIVETLASREFPNI